MRPLVLALACAGVTAAATVTAIALGPALGGAAALVAIGVGLAGAALVAVLCWRSCHLSPAATEVVA